MENKFDLVKFYKEHALKEREYIAIRLKNKARFLFSPSRWVAYSVYLYKIYWEYR